MEHKEVRRCLMGCPDLKGLDEASIAALSGLGQEHTFEKGETIYADGEELDYTFGLLVAGELLVEKAGQAVGMITGRQVFGEMAHFTHQCTRAATVRVASIKAVIMKFRLAPTELGNAQLTAIRNCLGRKTWGRFAATCLA